MYDGTVVHSPLSETNKEEHPRDVILKCRKLGGKRGKLIRAGGSLTKIASFIIEDEDKFFDRSMRVDMRLAHWAVQVGPYLWELHTDHKLANMLGLQRLTEGQIWDSDIQMFKVGETEMTDHEIDQAAYNAYSKMKGRKGGKYHGFLNNCHHFVILLLKLILDDNEKVTAEMLKKMALE